MIFKSDIMDEAGMKRALVRIAHEIVERNEGCDELCIVGIMRRGAALADIIAKTLDELGVRTKTGYLDITLYRDDLTQTDYSPHVISTRIDFPVTGKIVVLVDDVIFTGRTARSAMDAVIALGRPAKIQLAALIDRGHRELPIRADYIGKNIPTSRSENVVVHVEKFDSEANVKLYQKQS